MQCAKQDKRAAFSIPVKSMSFKYFDYRRHRTCAIARLVSQLGHIISIPNAAKQPYLAQRTHSIHSQLVMSGTQLLLSEPIPKLRYSSDGTRTGNIMIVGSAS